MKNNFFTVLFIYLLSIGISFAETFKFETSNIEIVENGELIYANKGKAISSDNNLEIQADKFEYIKKIDLLKAFNSGLALIKSENLKIEFDKMIIDQKNLIIKANGNIKVYQMEKGLIIKTSSIIYDQKNNILSSSTKSILTDSHKNIFNVDSFYYELNKDVLKIENVNFKDIENNNFNTSLAYINTKTNKLFGKNISIDLNNKSFNKNNEPRLKGNSVINDNNFTEITKGVFTTCKKRDSCPPWQLSAEKIQHDKKKKIINYKNAWLKVYNVPVMYFPKFFHPDPTVKRKSGFLVPTFKNSPNSGSFLNTPYFLAIAQNKDATFSPRFYTEDKFLLQTEYRQKNSESSHISDFSLFTKKEGISKSHFFYEYIKKFNIKNFDESNIDFKLQQTSNDTYLKTNKLTSLLIEDDETLENSFGINLYSNDLSIVSELTVYEDLDKKDTDRFEYILPKLNLVKKFDNKTKLDGDFSLESKNLIRNFDTNVFEKTNINDLLFSSYPEVTTTGFYNNYEFIFKNSNTDTQNSNSYKEDENYYLSGLFQFNSSLPLTKKNENYTNILNPKISLRLAPNSTKDLRNKEKRIDVNNIYSLNRISENNVIEGGVSLILGNDYSIFDEKNSKEVFGFKIANNLRFKENDDLPMLNQIGEKTSNIFSEISYSPNNYLSTKYNTSIQNNLSDVNYENFITDLKINNFVTTFDYLNENNSTGQNSYLTNTTKYSLNNSNSLEFSTRENKTSDLTEYYNFMYQYKNDCLSASIEYNKDYYSDRDIRPEENIFFKLTIIPFGETSSPDLKN